MGKRKRGASIAAPAHAVQDAKDSEQGEQPDLEASTAAQRRSTPAAQASKEAEAEGTQAYERAPRTAPLPAAKTGPGGQAGSRGRGLPVKTLDGQIVHLAQAKPVAVGAAHSAAQHQDIQGEEDQQEPAEVPPQLPAEVGRAPRLNKADRRAAKREARRLMAAVSPAPASDARDSGDAAALTQPAAKEGPDLVDDDDEGDDEGPGPGSAMPQQLPASPAAAAARRERLKQQMAVAASQLLQAPERHAGNLHTLRQLVSDADPQVRRLAMLSLTAVMKDIAPGYRIRLPTDKELAMPVSKEVRAQRDWESALLGCYKAFVRQLLAATGQPQPGKRDRKGAQQKKLDAGTEALATGRVAVSCLAGLLTALSHFNYAADLVAALVPLTACPDARMGNTACAALEALLRGDAHGHLALQVAQLVADLVRRRACRCRPQVVRVLLALRLEDALPASGAKKPQGPQLSRKQRKKQAVKVGGGIAAAAAAIAADLEAGAEAAPDPKARVKLQSATLEAVFELVFRVLKHSSVPQSPPAPSSASSLPAADASAADVAAPPLPSLAGAGGERRAAQAPPLLAPALELLALHSRLLSVEYYGDLLATLGGLLERPGLPLGARCQCLGTAVDLLSKEATALQVDRRGLFRHLQTALLQAALHPLQPIAPGPTIQPREAAGPAAGRAAQPSSTDGADAASSEHEAAADAVLAVADRMLTVHGRGVDVRTLAGAAKALAAAALQLPAKQALAALTILQRLIRQNSKLRSLLEAEGEAGPTRSPALPQAGAPGAAGDGAGCLWELALLARHAAAPVARLARQTAAEGGTQAGAPALPPPPPAGPAQAADRRDLKRQRRHACPDLSARFKAVASEVYGPSTDEGVVGEAVADSAGLCGELEVDRLHQLWDQHFQEA